MAKFLRLYDSDGMAKYACDNGKNYRAIEILDTAEVYDMYRLGEARQLHVDELGGERYTHYLAVVCNPEYAKQYPELFPAAYDEAFAALWEKGTELYGRK